jgi:hypothetical protein
MVGKGLIISTKTKGDFKYTAHECSGKNGESDKPFLQVSQIKAINCMSFFPKFSSFLHLCSKTINHYVCKTRTWQESLQIVAAKTSGGFFLDVGSGFRIHLGKSKKGKMSFARNL